MIDTLIIVGVGLIGGSLGLATRERGLVRRRIGVGRSRASLEKARELGTIDDICLDLDEAGRRGDLFLLCTPVDRIVDLTLKLAANARPGAIFTDAGSTKGKIVEQLDRRMPEGVHFVGSHPLAGSEKRGPEAAEARLFQDRWTVVTPTKQSNVPAVETVVQLWKNVGSRVRLLDPEEHDRALAVTSHLPHLVASALAGILPPDRAPLTASGFRDTTRIAAGDAEMWPAIFLDNRAAILDALTSFEGRLTEYRRAVEADDAGRLLELWTQGKQVRDGLG